MTFAEENYLKAIFHLERETKEEVSTNAIAEMMETKPSSVTDMLKRLAEKRFVSYVKYKGVLLTNEGKIIAANVIRKHRLWETFLVEKLHFQWDEVHEIAEQLEHIQSDQLVNRLDNFLGNPKYDPHGDPIPDEKGNFSRKDKELLSNIPLNIDVICVGVKDSDDEFLQYLNKRDINIGTKIHILNKEFDGSIEIRVGKKEFSVSKFVGDNLFVQET